MNQRFEGELRGTVQVLHDLAKNHDEVPTDALVVPLPRHPSRAEIQERAELGLELVEEWREHAEQENADEIVFNTLNHAEESFTRIREGEPFPSNHE